MINQQAVDFLITYTHDRAKAEEAIRTLRDLGLATTETANVTQKASAIVEQLGMSYNSVSQIFDVQSKTVQTASGAMNQYTIQCRMQDGTLKTLTGTFNAETGAIEANTAAMRTGASAVKGFNIDLGQLIARAFVTILVWGTLRSVFMAVASAVKNTMNVWKEYEAALTEISIASDLSKEQLQGLGAAVLTLGAIYGTSMKDMLEAAKLFAQQGLSVGDTIAMTRAAAIGSQLLGQTVKEVAENLTAAMRAYNTEAADSMRIIDQWMAVQKKFAVTSADLGNAFKTAGATASAFGITAEQYIGHITAIIEVTRKSGNEAANALQMVYTRLFSTGKEALQQIAETPIYLNDAKEAVFETTNVYRNAGDVMDELAAKWKNLTEAQKIQLAVQIGSRRQATPFLALMDNYPRAIEAMIEAYKSAGEAAKDFDKKQDTVAVRAKQLQSSWANLVSTLGDTSVWKGLLQSLTDLASTIQGLINIEKAYETSAIKANALELARAETRVNEIENLEGLIKLREKYVNFLKTAKTPEEKTTYIDVLEKINKAIPEGAKQFENLKDAVTSFNRELSKISPISFNTGDATTEIENVRNQVTDLSSSLQTVPLSLIDEKQPKQVELISKKVSELGDQLKNLTPLKIKEIESQANQLDDLKAKIKELGSNIAIGVAVSGLEISPEEKAKFTQSLLTLNADIQKIASVKIVGDTEEVTAIKKRIGDLDASIQNIAPLIINGELLGVDIEDLQEQLSDITQEKRNIRIELGVPQIEDVQILQKQLSELTQEEQDIRIKLNVPQVQELRDLQSRLSELTQEEKDIEIRIHLPTTSNEELDKLQTRLLELTQKRKDIELKLQLPAFKELEDFQTRLLELSQEEKDIKLKLDPGPFWRAAGVVDSLREKLSTLTQEENDIKVKLDIPRVKELQDLQNRLKQVTQEKTEVELKLNIPPIPELDKNIEVTLNIPNTDELEDLQNRLTALTQEKTSLELKISTAASSQDAFDKLHNEVLQLGYDLDNLPPLSIPNVDQFRKAISDLNADIDTTSLKVKKIEVPSESISKTQESMMKLREELNKISTSTIDIDADPAKVTDVQNRLALLNIDIREISALSIPELDKQPEKVNALIKEVVELSNILNKISPLALETAIKEKMAAEIKLTEKGLGAAILKGEEATRRLQSPEFTENKTWWTDEEKAKAEREQREGEAAKATLERLTNEKYAIYEVDKAERQAAADKAARREQEITTAAEEEKAVMHRAELLKNRGASEEEYLAFLEQEWLINDKLMLSDEYRAKQQDIKNRKEEQAAKRARERLEAEAQASVDISLAQAKTSGVLSKEKELQLTLELIAASTDLLDTEEKKTKVLKLQNDIIIEQLAQIEEISKELASSFQEGLEGFLTGETSFGGMFAKFGQSIKDAFVSQMSGGITESIFNTTGIGELFGVNLVQLKGAFGGLSGKIEAAHSTVYKQIVRAHVDGVAQAQASSQVTGGTSAYQGGGIFSGGGIGNFTLPGFGAGGFFSSPMGGQGITTAQYNKMSAAQKREMMTLGVGIGPSRGQVAGVGFGGVLTGLSMYQSGIQGGMSPTGAAISGVMGGLGALGMGIGTLQAGATAGLFWGGAAGTGAGAGMLGSSLIPGIGLALMAGALVYQLTQMNKKTSQTSIETRTQENRVASKIDVSNKQLEIVNRNLVALRADFATYILPASSYFSEKRNIEDQFALSSIRGFSGE